MYKPELTDSLVLLGALVELCQSGKIDGCALAYSAIALTPLSSFRTALSLLIPKSPFDSLRQPNLRRQLRC